MKTLLQWLRLHPIKAVLFTMIFTAIATSAAFRDDLTIKLVGTYAFFLGLWCLTFTLDMRKVMALFLAGLFSYSPAEAADVPPPQPENPAAVGIGVGCVVICVGGYCLYKIVKICQKKFPPKTAETNSNGGFSASGDDEYGGVYEYSSIGSCYVPPDLNSFPHEDLLQNPTTFTMNVSVQPASVRISMTANNEEGTTQTWEQFTDEVAQHGLFLTGRPAGPPQFSKNRVPCDSGLVPLSFDMMTGRVTHNMGGELRRIVIERSHNLQDWYPLMVTDVSDGSGFRVVDTTREGQMFYRVGAAGWGEERQR